MTSQPFTIVPVGPFSLAEAATFGFGQRDAASPDNWGGVMRLAFCLDSYQGHAGVELRQDQSGVVHGLLHGAAGAGPDAVIPQVARVLSLDHDGTRFERLGARDPVIGRLQAAAPGLRPPLFYSPYEAAVWSVLSARRPARQMMAVRRRLSEARGAVFELAGERLAALPSPTQLLDVGSFPGIPGDKLARMHEVARAALAGTLDVAHLTALGPERSMAQLQEITGIGPFYSALIVIRATGFTDVLPLTEPKVLDLTARLYQLDDPPGPARFTQLAEAWRPFRTWACVLIRAAGPRLLAPAPALAGGRSPGGQS